MKPPYSLTIIQQSPFSKLLETTVSSLSFLSWWSSLLWVLLMYVVMQPMALVADFCLASSFKIHPQLNMHQIVISLYGQIIYHSINLSCSGHPFTNWWTFELFAHFAIIDNVTMNILCRFLCIINFSILWTIHRRKVPGIW